MIWSLQLPISCSLAAKCSTIFTSAIFVNLRFGAGQEAYREGAWLLKLVRAVRLKHISITAALTVYVYTGCKWFSPVASHQLNHLILIGCDDPGQTAGQQHANQLKHTQRRIFVYFMFSLSFFLSLTSEFYCKNNGATILLPPSTIVTHIRTN